MIHPTYDDYLSIRRVSHGNRLSPDDWREISGDHLQYIFVVI